MPTVVRTNLATNPAVNAAITNWAAIPGTSGAASMAFTGGAGYQGAGGFARVTWTVATTVLSGGFSYTQTGLSAATQYAMQFYVKPSKNQKFLVTATFRNASNATVNTATGVVTNVTAGVWTQLFVVGTSGAAVTNVVISAEATTAGALWASGDSLDCEACCIETGNTPGTTFSGDSINGLGHVYAWTGTANASTSTETTYGPDLNVVAVTDMNPCPRTQISIASLPPTNTTMNIWRQDDRGRTAVRGGRHRIAAGSDYLVDYEVPIGRNVTYSVESLDGVLAGTAAPTAVVNCNAPRGCIQDPLVPTSAVAVNTRHIQGDGSPILQLNAFQSLDYTSAVNLVAILGNPTPVALMGQRQSAGNVDFSVMTDSTYFTAQMRALLTNAGIVLVRPMPSWGDYLPGLCYVALAKPVERPLTVDLIETATSWDLVGPLVSAPSSNIVIPVWTYGGVQALYTTYQVELTNFAGRSNLSVLANPT